MTARRRALNVALCALVLAVGTILGLAAGWRAFIEPRRARPTPAPEAVLPWSDDFSDPASGWRAELDSSAEVAYGEGALRVIVKAPNCLAWAFAGHEFDDFHLAVEATQADGPDNNEYGVLVRIEDRKHFYAFSVSGDGYYQVSKCEGDSRQGLSGEWAESDAVNRGAATNLLEVICRGDGMTFLVNGVQLAQVEDADYRQGDIGLHAGSFFEPGVEVRFDNLRITEPSP